MSGIIRAPRPPRGWTEIPDATIRDIRLSYRARGVLARLLSNADGYRMTAEDLARESPDGRYAVLSALRELRAAGYVVSRRLQGADGRWRTETYVYDTPQDTPQPQPTEVQKSDVGAPDATEVQKSDVGAPKVGSPDAIKHYQQDNQQDNQQQQHQQHQHERKRKRKQQNAAAAAPTSLAPPPQPQQRNQQQAAAAAPTQSPPPPPQRPQGGKRRRSRASGIVTWTTEDEAAAEALERAVDADELTVAIEAVRAAGREPVPGLVEQAVERLRRRREVEQRTAEQRAAAAPPPIDPDALARGAQIIAQIRAKRVNQTA